MAIGPAGLQFALATARPSACSFRFGGAGLKGPPGLRAQFATITVMEFITRRSAIGALLTAASSRFCAVLLDLRTRKVLQVERPDLASQWVIPPGSTLKPLTLTALLETGKLRADEKFSCPGKLIIRGRSFSCSHPRIGAPMRVSTAIAYSCNCFVAHLAQRFERGELARFLAKERIASRSGLLVGDEAVGILRDPADLDSQRLQAIGEADVMVTPLGLLAAYSRLAAHAPATVLEGLEGAVEYGTAQLAGSTKVKVAGKTGTVLTSTRATVAWFAGFAPSRKPEVVIVSAVQGRSGGLDAAPIAGRILGAHF